MSNPCLVLIGNCIGCLAPFFILDFLPLMPLHVASTNLSSHVAARNKPNAYFYNFKNFVTWIVYQINYWKNKQNIGDMSISWFWILRNGFSHLIFILFRTSIDYGTDHWIIGSNNNEIYFVRSSFKNSFIFFLKMEIKEPCISYLLK